MVVPIGLAGCAFGTRHPTLVYPPDESPGYMALAHAEPNAPIAARHVRVVLHGFADERADKNVVGTVRNGYGIRTADVVPTNSVSDWVTAAVRSELERSGYRVTRAETADDSGSYVVSGEILNVFCDMYLEFSGQVVLVATVRKDGRELLNKRYEGKGTSGIAVAATAESYAQSLARALASAIRPFVADVDRALISP
jgi:hypothetical protein